MDKIRMSRPPLNSAEFNLREIAKQMLLLEDHLTDSEKFCVDCIRKHMMMIEALADEAVQMDPSSHYTAECRTSSVLARRLLALFTDGTSSVSLAKAVRKKRKELVAMLYDPRQRS